MNILSHFPHLGTSKQPQKSGISVFTTLHRIKFESLRTKQTFSSMVHKFIIITPENISMVFTVLKELTT